MNKRINEGEKVVVVMSEKFVFPWQEDTTFAATLLLTPAGEGDVFTFEVEGVKVSINGNSPKFVGYYKE